MKKLLAAILTLALALLATPALAQVRMPMARGTNGTTPVAAQPVVSLTKSGLGSGNATYRVVGSAYTAYATPTDLFCISGSATKTVAVVNIYATMQSTAATSVTLYGIRRSAPDTGGTSTNPAAVALDSADPAATGVVTLYTAAPTLGTSAGTAFIILGTTGTLASFPAPYGIYPSGNLNAGGQQISMVGDLRKPLTLHGTAESFCLNFGGAALPAGFTANYVVETIEY